MRTERKIDGFLPHSQSHCHISSMCYSKAFFHHNAENWYEIKSCCYAEFFVIRFDLFSSSVARFSSSPSNFPLLHIYYIGYEWKFPIENPTSVLNPLWIVIGLLRYMWTRFSFGSEFNKKHTSARNSLYLHRATSETRQTFRTTHAELNGW